MLRTSLIAILLPVAAAAQLSRPASWQYRTDSPVPDSTTYYVGMPPGWHMTTQASGAVFWDPAYQGRGRYAVDAEIFLFGGESNDGYGVFIGGSRLSEGSGSWIGFLLTRDGSATIVRQHQGSQVVLHPVTKSAAVKPHPGGNETVFNTLRVAVERDSLVFSANGQRITAVAHAGLAVEGTFGFRMGRGINVHASNLDIVTRLAPVPARRPALPMNP